MCTSKALARICGFDGPIMTTIVKNPESAYVKKGLLRKIGVELPKPGFQRFHGHEGKVGRGAGGGDGA
jgi:hypothetical protein